MFGRRVYKNILDEKYFIPLSIAFIDQSGVIIGHSDMEVEQTTNESEMKRHQSKSPAKICIRAKTLVFKDKNIKVGDQL